MISLAQIAISVASKAALFLASEIADKTDNKIDDEIVEWLENPLGKILEKRK